jgi:GMP synthase-like glutamine amidotransferase
MESVLRAKGHQLSATHLYDNQALPSCNEIDWLIVMGGPMGVYDEDTYPWLCAEKRFIKDSIDSGKTVLGICLGAQLIADALGARVYKNIYHEIGWFSIKRRPEAKHTILANALPEQADVFHWHGDTFDIPRDASALAESEACKNQGFILHDRVVALQFHLETTWESATALIENCRHELDASQYVQTEEELLSNTQRFSNINQIMASILDALEGRPHSVRDISRSHSC